MADYAQNGYQYIPTMLGPQNSQAIAFMPDGSAKFVSRPFGTAVEYLSVTSAGVPTLAGASLTSTTLTAPVLSGSVTGTYTLAGTPTLTSPAINTPTIVGGTLDPTIVTKFGAGTGTGKNTGTLYTGVSLQVNATGSSLIADKFLIPANSLAAGRYLTITVWGKHAANTNATTMNVNVGGTGNVNGAVTGGTNIFTDMTVATSAGVEIGEAWLIRIGASSQQYVSTASKDATALAALSGTLSATDTADIQVNLMINCATVATDLTAFWIVTFGN